MSKRDLNELVAIHVMGWKWMRLFNIPIRGTPGYPEKCTVRRLLSARELQSKQWQAVIQGEADGTEPLDYSYCSSAYRCIPDYSHSEEDCEIMEDRLEKLGLLDALPVAIDLVKPTAKEAKRPYKTTCRQICEAALLVMKEREPHENESRATAQEGSP